MTYTTFFKSVYVIKQNPEDYNKLEGIPLGRVFKYTSDSDTIIVHIGNTFLHIAVGHAVTEPVLKNLVYVALTHKKPVKLEFCESLKNLQVVDQTILQINEYLGFKDLLS